MCLAQGPQRSDAGEAQNRGPSVSSQALYHWATALPNKYIQLTILTFGIVSSFKEIKCALADIYFKTLCKQTAKTLLRLLKCAGWANTMY